MLFEVYPQARYLLHNHAGRFTLFCKWCPKADARVAGTSGASVLRTFSRRMEQPPMECAPKDKIPAPQFVSVDLKADEGSVGNSDSSGSARNGTQCDIDFGDHKAAFSKKRAGEIARALCVLKMCSVNTFVDNSLTMMKWSRRLLGRWGTRALLKPVFYKQFVGGETCKEVQECMGRVCDCGIRPMLAATMEEEVDGDGEGAGNEKVYDTNCSRILECMELSSQEATISPKMQLKMTGLLSMKTLSSLGNLYSNSQNKAELIRAVAKGFTDEGLIVELIPVEFDEQQITSFRNALSRLRRIGEEAVARGVKVLVDSEYTYVNPGLSLLTLAMASTYNKNAAMIWNTYQCYLKNAYDKAREELSLTEELGVHFGAKLVRGAYVVHERSRAEKLGLPDPVCADYQATCDNYNRVLEFLLNKTKEKWPRCALMIATHNEESIKLAVKKMKELGLENQCENVCFGQLYGMSDNITYPLAVAGYSVYKSIPYGTVEEVLPYLARRVVENKSVLEGTRKERTLLWKEMKHRLRIRRGHRSST